jgi:competence protein ComEC
MKANIGIIAAVVGLMCGILCRSFSLTWPYLLALVLGSACLLVWFRRVRMALVLVGVFAGAFLLGSWRMDAREAHFDAQVASLAPYVSQDVVFEGLVIRDPEARERAVVLVVQLEGSAQKLRVSAPRGLEVAYGDWVEVSGVLERPEAFESELGRTFPYEEYLRAHGITHTVSSTEVRVASTGGGYAPLRALFFLKHRFAESVSALLPEPHASFALGLLLGEKHGLGERLESVFRTVGIIHIIVLSGYNLTIIAEALMRVLKPVLMPRPRSLVGALAIIAFALAVGPSATVVRATLMALLVLFARVTGRTYDALRALFAAGACMVLFNPYTLAFDPGFQFSFLATLGLILLGPLVDRALAFLPSYAGVREYASSTIATQIAVAPLLLWSVGSVSLIAVIANILILVAVPLAMLLTFIAGLVGLVVPDLVFVAYPAYLVLAYILTAAEFFARVPFAEYIAPPFPFWMVAAVYTVLGAVLLFVYTREPKTPAEEISAGVPAAGLRAL